MDFNPDEIEEKISKFKDQVQVMNEKHGAIFKSTDPMVQKDLTSTR
ncbi:MAG: hypothetical protein GYA24_12865 [Candidatus Lokiarchaeota archaeon]|nr:hypothetical protein [Candidatus Lokiarchaeota archaeon]